LCIDALRNAFASVPAFDLRMGNLESFSPPHILFRSVELTDGLRALHERTLDIVATYKTPWIRPDFAALTLDEKQREYLERYGSPFVRSYYHPHLTLAGPDVQYHDFVAVRAAMPSVTTRVLTHVPLRS
jgi:2'-5' RNA ligase